VKAIRFGTENAAKQHFFKMYYVNNGDSALPLTKIMKSRRRTSGL